MKKNIIMVLLAFVISLTGTKTFAAPNFVDNNTTLPANKTDKNPITNPTQQWGAADANTVFGALTDLRTVAQRGWVNVTSCGSVKVSGVVGDGSDDTTAIQAAINATQGRTLYFPAGKYLVTSTLTISTTNHHLIGDFGQRNNVGGTEISCTGTGPCIQIGSDNGHQWDAGDYDGPQDQLIENLWISHGAPDTALTAANAGSTAVYKTGAYGIWDWRGGGITLRNIGIEKFEANFVGIQSDLNTFQYMYSLYSKWGLYIGPRSDQQVIHDVYSFFCDRAVTIDRAGGTNIYDSRFVADGTNTASSVEIRQGSHGVRLVNIWFERSGGGYQGTDAQSFVSVGEVSGYGTGGGGSIVTPGTSPVTSSVQGITIQSPHCYSVLPGVASHTKYLATVGKATGMLLSNPSEYINSSLNNFDNYIAVQNNGLNPSNSDTQILVTGVDSATSFSKIFTNLGAGLPSFAAKLTGTLGPVEYANNNSAFGFRFPDHSTGADQITLDTQGNAGNVFLSMPTYTGGQTIRMHLSRAQNTTTAASGPPTTGTWERGDMVRVVDPTQSGYAEWICWVAGTPGVWGPANQIAGRELQPTALAANTNDFNPSSFSSTEFVFLTASTPVNLTGMAAGTVAVGQVGSVGAKKYLYNGGANNITLTHQDASSTAANRFIGVSNANTVLTPGIGKWVYYSPSQLRWIVQ
jgi:hypothetical protein